MGADRPIKLGGRVMTQAVRRQKEIAMNNDTSPKPFAFVIMPFLKEFDDIYQLGIKPVCEKFGAYAERVDEQIFHESILQRIYNQISKADVIIADMTGRNPNVFYEAGYAHALGKPVILLTQAAEDIPFDLKHYPHIVYGGRITDLIPELERRVKFAIDQPKEAAKRDSVEVYVGGKNLKYNNNLSNTIDQQGFAFEVRLDFHNSVNTRFKKTTFQLGIFTSNKIRLIYTQEGRETRYFQSYEQPEANTILHLDSKTFNLLPGSWDVAVPNILCHDDNKITHGEIIELTLRIFTEEGPFDFPFYVTFYKQEQGSNLEEAAA